VPSIPVLSTRGRGRGRGRLPIGPLLISQVASLILHGIISTRVILYKECMLPTIKLIVHGMNRNSYKLKIKHVLEEKRRKHRLNCCMKSRE